MPENFTQIIIYIVIVIAVLLLIREINCWYWKINLIIDHLNEIENRMAENNESIKNIEQKIDAIYKYGINVRVLPESDNYFVTPNGMNND